MGDGIDRPEILACLVLAPVLWGGNFVVGSTIAHELPGIWINFLRWLIALLILLPFCVGPVWRHRAILLQYLRGLVVMALLGVTLFNTVLYIALQTASVSIAAVAFAVTPFMTTGVLLVIQRERPSPWFVAASAIALSGMILAQWQSLKDGAPILSVLMVLLAALIWSGYCVALKQCAVPAPGRAVFFSQIVLGSVFMIPALVFIGIPEIGELSLGGWAALFYLGVFAAAIAFWLWQQAVTDVGPAQASLFMNLVPISSIMLGAVFLGGSITRVELIAFALVICGIFLASPRAKLRLRLLDKDKPATGQVLRLNSARTQRSQVSSQIR